MYGVRRCIQQVLPPTENFDHHRTRHLNAKAYILLSQRYPAGLHLLSVIMVVVETCCNQDKNLNPSAPSAPRWWNGNGNASSVATGLDPLADLNWVLFI